MENMFLMLYSVLKSLGANGGWWGGMEMSPNMGEIPKMRKICTQQSQNWGYLWPTEYTACMENMFLMFYQVICSVHNRLHSPARLNELNSPNSENGPSNTTRLILA